MVSDLRPENSTIIAMRYSKEKNHIYPETLKLNTYALSAENILYNIFNTRTINNHYLDAELHNILNLISQSDSDLNQIKSIYSNLKNIVLDENDPLNLVLKQIRTYIEKESNA